MKYKNIGSLNNIKNQPRDEIQEYWILKQKQKSAKRLNT